MVTKFGMGVCLGAILVDLKDQGHSSKVIVNYGLTCMAFVHLGVCLQTKNDVEITMSL